MTVSKRAITISALLASSAFIPAFPAFAQAPAQPEASNVEEVVVTARRREESLQDVPVAVSAYGGAALERAGTRDITDLQKTTPSLTVQPARGSNSTLIAFIRGVGQQDPLWGFEPGVGLYLDDVYVARPQAAVLDVFDVERIEVLRGPQGTLYGRNTIGGAIKYVTARIGDEPEMNFRARFGSYGQREGIASAKAMVTDTLGLSLAFGKFERDGFGKNLNTGKDHYDKDVFALRASAEWSPTDSLFFRLSGDRVVDKSNARHGHRESVYTHTNGVTYGPPADVFDTNAGAGDENRVVAQGLSFLGQWEASPNLTFKSISAYRDGRTDGNIDFDETPLPLLDIPAQYRDHQFSQEFQALFTGERWNGVAGVYYMNATAAGAFDTVLANGVPGLGLTIYDGGYVDTRSYAAFADLSYNLTERLQISVGGRYTRDKKSAQVIRQQYLGIRSRPFGNAAATPVTPALTNYMRERSFEKFTPRVSVSYKFSPDLTGYASYGRGFKSGGFDMRGDAAAYPNTVNGFAPETVTTYEAGLKGALLERRLNFATAVFESRYKDQQITTQYPNSTGGIASVVDNAGSSRIRGVEAESTLRLASALSLRGSVSYLDTKFLEYVAFIPGSGLTDVASQRKLQNTPKWTGSVSALFTHDMGEAGSISFIPQAAYRSFTQQFETPAPLLDQPAYWLYDTDLVWTSPSGRYEIGLHGKNLSDKHYKIGGYTFPGALFGNSISAFYGAPRTWTVSLGAKF